MSDEVKQAADRLRRCRESDCGYVGMFADVDTLIAGYLSGHTNDAENTTLLTAEILQASGCQDCSCWWFAPACGRTALRLRSDGLTWSVDGMDGYLETVGDLRKLLESLHIPAVVTVPKGGE